MRRSHSSSSIDTIVHFHQAVASGDTREVLRLISLGAPINAKDAGGNTPLHTAVRQHDREMVRTLLTLNGIDVNIKDHNNKPAIAYALGDSNDEAKAIVELLKRRGAVDQTEYFNEQQPNDQANATKSDAEINNSMETPDVVDGKFLRKLVITFAVPFIILIFVNGIFFAIKFVAITLLFYFVMSGYFVSEISIKPPWYHHMPGAKLLSLKDCPDYWEGMLHNPLYNLKLKYEDVNFQSTDGFKLSGWFVPSTRPESEGGVSKMGVVLVHGGGRDRRAWLRHLPMFLRNGYSCLLFDFREHGLSQGASRGFTYGMMERHDVVAACKYMRETLGFKYIAAVGTSVGGSSVIMAAHLDKSIDVVVSENPVLTAAHLQDNHVKNLIGSYFTHNRISDWIFIIFRFMCSNWLNWRLRNKPSKHCQAMHVIGTLSPRPVMLLHGTYDDVVPPYHSEMLFDKAHEPKELWLCPQAVHCCLYNKAPVEYEERVFSFLRKYDPSRADGTKTADIIAQVAKDEEAAKHQNNKIKNSGRNSNNNSDYVMSNKEEENPAAVSAGSTQDPILRAAAQAATDELNE